MKKIFAKLEISSLKLKTKLEDHQLLLHPNPANKKKKSKDKYPHPLKLLQQM